MGADTFPRPATIGFDDRVGLVIDPEGRAFTAWPTLQQVADLVATVDTDPVAQAALADHMNDTSDAHDASAVSLLDAGNWWTATDLEALAAEIPDRMVGSGTIRSIVKLTQVAYDALTPDAATLYVVIG